MKVNYIFINVTLFERRIDEYSDIRIISIQYVKNMFAFEKCFSYSK